MRNAKCGIRSVGSFLLKQKFFLTKIFSAEKINRHFELRILHFELKIQFARSEAFFLSPSIMGCKKRIFYTRQYSQIR